MGEEQCWGEAALPMSSVGHHSLGDKMLHLGWLVVSPLPFGLGDVGPRVPLVQKAVFGGKCLKLPCFQRWGRFKALFLLRGWVSIFPVPGGLWTSGLERLPILCRGSVRSCPGTPELCWGSSPGSCHGKLRHGAVK